MFKLKLEKNVNIKQDNFSFTYLSYSVEKAVSTTNININTHGNVEDSVFMLNFFWSLFTSKI